jgi:parallel beta-helix repeat protein
LDKSIKNTIVQYNNITDNSIGIKIFGKFKNGVIKNNNFIENDISISYKIFFFQRLRINANYWGETKLLPKSIPGYSSIYLFTYTLGEHQGHEIFLHFPKIIIDWHPAQEPYDIPGIS